MSKKERTCITCEHLDFDVGERGYSKLTPGYNASAKCKERKWEWKIGEALLCNMMMARDCELYKYYGDSR